MTKIDQFESIFRSASKEKFEPQEIRVENVLVVTDVADTASQAFLQDVKAFLQGFSQQYRPNWTVINGDDFSSVESLVERICSSGPDLICTYRNLHTPAIGYPYSLGVYVDVLTQTTDIPILLMPRPEVLDESQKRRVKETGAANVMAITDHLAGDHHLVNVAALLVKSGGRLLLTHVEDQYYFDRFLNSIDKIADIDSEVAKEKIMQQLLAEPRDYIQSCREVIEKSGNVEVKSIVTVGHLLKDHLQIIEENEVDLLILHTKDDDQLAMHGLAYPLAVEMRTIPMLLL